MRILILTCLIFAIACNNYQRDFLTGFVRAVSTNDKYELKSSCFGEESDKFFKLTIEGLVSFNLDKVVEGFSTMVTLYYFDCPSEPGYVMTDYVRGIKDLTVLKNFFKNSGNILKFNINVLKNIFEKNYYGTGYNLGKILSSIIYDKNYMLFLN
jgi:hypothetical protein